MTSAYAVSGEEFCQSYLELSQKSAAKVNHKALLTVMFNPKKIIRATTIQSLDEGALKVVSTSEDKSPGEKIIFIHMPQPRLTTDDTIDELRSLQKEITKSSLMKRIKKARTLDSCMEEIKKDESGFLKLSHYLEVYESKKDLIEEEKQIAMNLQIDKKLKIYQKQGWKVVYTKNLFDFYNKIQNGTRISEIMMISHSDELGRLYDAEKNIFPKKAFGNLPKTITKIIMFSCHSRKVVDYYSIAEASQYFDYYFPEIREDFQQIFQDRIPVLAIKGLLKSAKAKSRKELSESQCSLDLNLEESRSKVILTLNNEFIGTLNEQAEIHLNIDCSRISSASNQVRAFYLGQKMKTPLGVTNILIRNQKKQETSLEIKEYLSSNGHSHILTIGTTGGIL